MTALLTLTAGVEDVVGTAGNDKISALVKASATDASTYETGDNIDGGAGTDTLNLLIADDADLDDEIVEMANVEKVVIRSLDDAGGDAVQADLWTGVTHIESARSLAGVSVANVQNNVTLAVTDSAENLTVTFEDDAIGSAEAELAIQVNGAGTAAADSVIAVNIGGDDAFTKLTIDAEGDDSYISVDIDVEELTEVKVTGGAAIEITETGNNFDDVTVFDASGNSGGVTWATDDEELETLKGGSGDDSFDLDDAVAEGATINLGAGDDTLIVDATELNDAAEVDGGTGTDIISSAAVSIATAELITNFEGLDVTGQTADTSVDATLLVNSSISQVVVSGAINGGVVVSGVKLGGNITVTGTTDLGGGDLRVTYASATGTSDVANIVFETEVAADNNFDDVRLDSIETINITSGGDVTSNVIAELISNAVVTINVTGDQAFTLSDLTNLTAGGLTTFKTLDASKATGVQTITLPDLVADQTDAVAVAVSYTVKLGEANDVLTLVAADASDNKTTTANVDVSAGGDDNINLAGFVSDTASVVTGTVGSIVVITGLDEGDSITFDDTAMDDDALGDAVDVTAATSLAAAINLSAAGADVSWFVYGGNTYIVADINDSGTYTTADTVVKLIGTYDLSTATILNSVVTIA